MAQHSKNTRQKSQQKSQQKSTSLRFRFVLLSWLATAAVCTTVLYHYENLLSPTDSSVHKADASVSAETPVPYSADAQSMSLSSDGTKLAIANGMHLDVYDMQDARDILSMDFDHQISYLQWIDDGSMFLGTKFNNGTPEQRLSTLSISDKSVRVIHTFHTSSSDVTFRDIVFSSYTNDTYILMGNQDGSVSHVYHYDANNTLREDSVGGRIVNRIGVGATDSGTLFFQDYAAGTPNLLYMNAKQGVNLIERDAVLLRVINNTVYFGELDSSNQYVQAVYSYTPESQPTLVRSLPDSITPDEVFVDHSGAVNTAANQRLENISNGSSRPATGTLLVKDDGVYDVVNNTIKVLSY